ncbi:MAG: hypothetical protein ACK552_16515 [Microcystis sp.]
MSNDLTTAVEGEIPFSNPNTPDAWVYTDVNFSGSSLLGMVL